MAVATAQFTQGVNVGGSGQSVFGFLPNQLVTLTDDGGPGATSYLWEMLSWPATLATPPNISNATLQVATVTPTEDGVYIARITRDDPIGGVTTDIKFFGVQDEDGLTLPSPGQTGAMTNMAGTASQLAGWGGRQTASTNSQLDAFLRFLKARVGRYVGHVLAVTHSSSSPVTVQLTDGTDKPYRIVTMTGSGSRTTELVNPALSDGKRFRFLVAMTAGCGDFILKNGVGGTTINTISAPPSGTITYELEAVFDGTDWNASRANLADARHLRKYEVVELLAGNRSTDQQLFTRLGTGQVDPSKFPPNAQIKFEACVEATVGKVVEVRLYNLTDGGYVAAAMSSGSTTPATLTQTVTLPSGLKVYEVHLRMTTSGGVLDRVTCTNARIVLTWG